MSKKIVLASAGAGKTYRIVKDSIDATNTGQKVLVVTYTENNQKEILLKFRELGGEKKDNFHVKGLFTFLLDDLIRPYQNCIFPGRIETINFNDTNPHKKGNYTIRGRHEINSDGSYNPLCYLTSDHKKAHTMFLAKLATKIIKESKGKTIARLEEIYSHIYFDEVQDLVGWDYDVIKALSKSKKIDITCVGDFRQTIYETSTAPKQPKTNLQKIEKFRSMKFDFEQMSTNRRSIQDICCFADKIHANEGYEMTTSLVDYIPEKFREHLGVFIVKQSDVEGYIKKFKPTLLKRNILSGRQFKSYPIDKINFGKSKGMGFNRVLVLPTDNYVKYLTGNEKALEEGKTDESKNKLYVAVTRARYSIGFIIKDSVSEKCGLPIWER